MLRLLLKDGSGTWAAVNFLEKLGLFQKRPELLKSEKYAIESDVSLDVLDVFLARVFGKASPSGVTEENVGPLKSLCGEFGFHGFDSEFEAASCEKALARRELCGLRDRVDAHDVLLGRLERQLLAFRRQSELWQREFERRLREVSRESQAGLERVESGLRDEMHELDVRHRLSAVDEEFQEVKRELSSLKDESSKVDLCEKSLSCLSDEVKLLKDAESRVKSELRADIDDVSLLWRATVKTCIFSWMREREAKLGRKMVVVRQSSNDIYGWLDPDSSDKYGSKDNPGAWIEIEFKAPVRVNGLKITSSNGGGYPKTFDVTFSDGPGSDAKRKVSFVDEEGLKGENRSVERKFDAVTAKLVRIESRGPNWDGDNFLILGGFELFSPDEAHAGGVFRSIFARDRDRVWDSFDVRARDFDWSELHVPNDTNVCTFMGERQWVEVGFLHGQVGLSGYRIQKYEDRLRGWSLRASNDRNSPLEEWRVLHRHREATEAEKTSEVLTFECASPTPFRFFRVVNEEKQWNGNLNLNFEYFDIDGAFILD